MRDISKRNGGGTACPSPMAYLKEPYVVELRREFLLVVFKVLFGDSTTSLMWDRVRWKLVWSPRDK